MQGLIRIAGGTSVILLSSLVTLSRGVASDYPLLRGRTRPFPGRAFREQRGHWRSPPLPPPANGEFPPSPDHHCTVFHDGTNQRLPSRPLPPASHLPGDVL